MQKYSNSQGISLPMAVWLARDEYKHDDRTNVISVTTLLKSTREIVLTSRVPSGTALLDISSLLASRLGTSLHNSVEQAWTENHAQAMADLGMPPGLIKRVKVNPTNPEPDDICVYLEQRVEKVVGKWIISGQYDIVFNGQVQDVKSTSTFTYTAGIKAEDYTLQGSLYRWLSPPDLIVDDVMAVQFLFKDWSANRAKSDSAYPKLPILEQKFPLLSVQEADSYVHKKLTEIEYYWDKPDSEIPLCTPKELWQRGSTFKYYANPDAKRATKNFDNLLAAQQHLAEKGKGIVKEVKDQPTKCLYCNAASVCEQFKDMVSSGELTL